MCVHHQVMGFKELCQVFEVPEVEPQVDVPAASSQLTEFHTFLSSPASNSKRFEMLTNEFPVITFLLKKGTFLSFLCLTCWFFLTSLWFNRRREDDMQAHRGSFLATPTAELSSQEEMLLGDILDWSLDTSLSGYEGDRESEGEKDGECE